MGKDSFLIEGVELIPDIDFEHSRPFWNHLGHSRIIRYILERSGTFQNKVEQFRII